MAVEAWQWRQVGQRPGLAHLADGGILEPIVRLTNAGVVQRKGLFGRQAHYVDGDAAAATPRPVVRPAVPPEVAELPLGN
eukprot:4251233-Pyramimonas_sp.AAC.1